MPLQELVKNGAMLLREHCEPVVLAHAEDFGDKLFWVQVFPSNPQTCGVIEFNSSENTDKGLAFFQNELEYPEKPVLDEDEMPDEDEDDDSETAAKTEKTGLGVFITRFDRPTEEKFQGEFDRWCQFLKDKKRRVVFRRFVESNRIRLLGD